MNLIVNDIESILALDAYGRLNDIYIASDTLSITNVLIHQYSHIKQKRIRSLKEKGLNEIEVDMSFYDFINKHKSLLASLGDGDKSSIYIALINDSCVITENYSLITCANILNVKVISTRDLCNKYISDENIKSIMNDYIKQSNMV